VDDDSEYDVVTTLSSPYACRVLG